MTEDGKTLVVGLRGAADGADGHGDARRAPVTFRLRDQRPPVALAERAVHVHRAGEHGDDAPGAIAVVDNHSGEVVETWEYPAGRCPTASTSSRRCCGSAAAGEGGDALPGYRRIAATATSAAKLLAALE